MESGKFKINVEKGVVVYALTSKGEKFVGVAKTAPGDTFDEAIGKAIACRRVDLAIRKRDLMAVRIVKCRLKYLKEDIDGRLCKLYTVYFNDACAVERMHLEKIRLLKKELKCLENGLPVPKRIPNDNWPAEKVYKKKSRNSAK